MPNSIFLDQTGFLADSNLYDASRWQRPLSTKQRNALIKFKNAYSQARTHLEDQPRRRKESEYQELTQGRRTIFIPLQVRSDTVLRYFSNGRPYEEFLRDVSSLARRHQSVRFIYKPHPQDSDVEIEGAYRCDWHIDDLIRASDRIITFNSGVGVLALLHNKPVAVYGRAFYDGENIVKKLLTPEDMDLFACENKLSMSTVLQDQFLFYLVSQFYTDVRFMSRPLAPKNARKIAMKVKTVRVSDPDNGCFYEETEPSGSSLMEYGAAFARFLRNRLDETFRFRDQS